ncbi:MAG: amino acid permease [Cytophagia bacterium]|nr:amino acid permease [Cytophagia bacterium]
MSAPKEKEQLARTLGLWSTIALVVGGVIGSGIFLKPSLMASQLGSPLLLLFVWILAGVITLFGALSNAEVAAMLPETGGQYIFFRKMYGDFVAFLYGWSAFIVINTAGVASIAYVAGTYAEYYISLPRFSIDIEQAVYLYIPGIGRIFPLENIGVKLFTIGIIIILTFINYRSTKAGAGLQVLFTLIKVASIGLLIIGIFTLGDGAVSHFVVSSTNKPAGWALVLAIVAALSGAFWGYDGWNNITFVAGEIKNPQQNIAKSLLIGILACIVVYALIILAYLFVMDIGSIAATSFVASEAAQIAMGGIGGILIALLVIFSGIGSTNANIMATARVTFAMAQEKRFFSWTANIHPTFQTPANALLLHAIWTCVLVLSGSFDMLTDMLIFVSWLFYGLSAVGVFVLRKKMPNAHRPYQVWGYPLVPGIFVTVTFFFLILTLVNDITNYVEGRAPIINSLFGLLLVALGTPLYFYFKKKAGK